MLGPNKLENQKCIKTINIEIVSHNLCNFSVNYLLKISEVLMTPDTGLGFQFTGLPGLPVIQFDSFQCGILSLLTLLLLPCFLNMSANWTLRRPSRKGSKDRWDFIKQVSNVMREIRIADFVTIQFVLKAKRSLVFFARTGRSWV